MPWCRAHRENAAVSFAACLAAVAVARLALAEGPSGATAPSSAACRPPLARPPFRLPETRDPRDYPRANYPLTDAELRQVAITGDYSRVLAALHKLATTGHAKALVFGGSETAGADCYRKDFGVEKKCAWSANLRRSIRRLFPNSTFELENLAVGGTTSCNQATRLGWLLLHNARFTADLVILDTLVNDFYIPNGPVCLEAMIRTLHDIMPCAGLFLFFARTKHSLVQRNIQLAEYYGLPYVDWNALMGEHKRAGGPSLWVGSAHPRWHTHQVISDAIVSVWSRAWNSGRDTAGAPLTFPSTPLSPTASSLESFLCPRPLTVYSAYTWNNASSQAMAPKHIGGDWQLYEDRRNKPGWISEQPGSRISFPLLLGPRPLITIAYLMSYAGIGNANATVAGATHTLTGKWRSKVSQTHTDFIVSAGDARKLKGKTVLRAPLEASAATSLELEFLGPEGKFKLVEQLSC